MEEHVILRVPEHLQESFNQEINEQGYPSCAFDFSDKSNPLMIYNNETYRISKIKLPCILESQKTIDGNQFYKINDVSNMLVVWPIEYTDEEIKKNIEIYSCSGITPPLKYVKFKRWKKRANISHKNEDIERKVRELLRKDSLASRVEVQKFNTCKTEEDDVSSIAAELEKDLRSSEENEKNIEQIIHEEDTENTKFIKQQLQEIESKIQEKKEFLKNSTNIIVKKRFEEAIKSLEMEYNSMKEKLSN